MRIASLLLTVLTGFTGLVYEITWQKALAILLGSHSEATAAVLAIFLGGLSVGYALFGRVSTRVTRAVPPEASGGKLLLVYGAVEACIGLWALAWPALFHAARSVSAAVALESEAGRFAFDLLLTVILLGPPTVLMGGTIPILTQALARGVDDSTRIHAFVYGTNTLGAFSGALAAGFFLIPWLGIPGVLAAMAALNLGAGAAFALLSRRAGSGPAPAVAAAPAPPSFWVYALAAALLGFAMMALQTVLIRVGGLALGASHFSFAVTVATFVLCIAVGSLAVSPWSRIPAWVVAACPLAVGLGLLLLYPLVPYATYAAHVVRALFASVDPAFYPYFLTASLGLLAAFLVPLGLAGASLPLLFHALRREREELGGLAGRLYGWNTVGSVAGALLGGYLLLFWIDLHHVYRIAAVAVLAAGGLLWLRAASSPRRLVAGSAAAALALGGIAWLPPWSPELLAAGFFRQRAAQAGTFEGPGALLRARSPFDTLFYDDDPTTSVSVIEMDTESGARTRAIKTNGKSDGSLQADYPTMALAGLVPCTMAEACRSAFVIGLGTGVTAGELAELETMERVRVSEISPGVIDAAPLFDAGNRGASRSEKVEIVRSDAYRALLQDPSRWDVIVSEPSNPWVAGVEMLFSREFLEAARDRLAPGGVYAQWMHAYETDDAVLELVLRTYAQVFDHVAVWFAQSTDLLLLGFDDASARPDLERIAERFARDDLRAGMRRSGVESIEALLAHELIPVGAVAPETIPGEVHTLLHPRLSHRAARAFFAGGQARLPVLLGSDAAPPLLTRWKERGGGGDELYARAVEEVCETRMRECATHFARWLHEQPDRREEIERRLAEERERSGATDHLHPQRVELLASLFADGPGRLDAEATHRVTNHFFEYYLHAAPFRREALEKTWRTCLGPSCASVIADSRRRLAAASLGYNRDR